MYDICANRNSNALSISAYSRKREIRMRIVCRRENKSFANAIYLNAHIQTMHNQQHFYKCVKRTKTAINAFVHIGNRHRLQLPFRLYDYE